MVSKTKKVKCPKEEKETKYTLAFHAEGKNNTSRTFVSVQVYCQTFKGRVSLQFTAKEQTNLALQAEYVILPWKLLPSLAT